MTASAPPLSCIYVYRIIQESNPKISFASSLCACRFVFLFWSLLSNCPITKVQFFLGSGLERKISSSPMAKDIGLFWAQNWINMLSLLSLLSLLIVAIICHSREQFTLSRASWREVNSMNTPLSIWISIIRLTDQADWKLRRACDSHRRWDFTLGVYIELGCDEGGLWSVWWKTATSRTLLWGSMGVILTSAKLGW